MKVALAIALAGAAIIASSLFLPALNGSRSVADNKVEMMFKIWM